GGCRARWSVHGAGLAYASRRSAHHDGDAPGGAARAFGTAGRLQRGGNRSERAARAGAGAGRGARDAGRCAEARRARPAERRDRPRVHNVVHVIKTAVALLQRRGSADEQACGFLHMIKRNADRAAGLSQHLLALARRQPLKPVATDVNDVVATVVALLRQTLSENITVEEQLDEALSWVLVDRSELEAALLHVAANARDAMPQGGSLSFHTAE